MKIAIFQMEDRGDIDGNIRAAYNTIIKTNADFFCLPEFFSIPADYKNRGKTVEDAWEEVTKPTLKALLDASKEFRGYIIGGSVVEKDSGRYYNTCYVIKAGNIVGKYRKINPTQEELEMGITPGKNAFKLETGVAKFGLLICADCLYEETVRSAAEDVDLVFLPISLTNPSHPTVEGHPVSEKIAKKYNVTVVKISRVASGLGVKSAVVTPKGVLYEASSCCEEELMVVEL